MSITKTFVLRMNETILSMSRAKKSMNMTDFYTIETPPSSSTSKDSTDEFLSGIQSNKKLKLSTDKREEKSTNTILCSISTTTNSGLMKNHQFDGSLYDDMHTPLRRTLGNTKLKTRQDVRRFRKFLKRNYDVASVTLIDIDPDTMRTYLIDYLTSIRTRKGLKYDPETLRSYYLSIQRFLKDSNYPFCLRNSPQFAQCRDLIIQMRKEKNQTKSDDFSPTQTVNMKKARLTIRKISSSQQTSFTCNTDKQQQIHLDHQPSSSETLIPIVSTKDLLPSSSLPPRKRQQMKYFLEFGSPDDFILLPKPLSSPPISSPSSILASNAYFLLIQLTHISSNSSSHHSTQQMEQLLDQSPICGNLQRSMLTRLCHEWTGDIRLIHENLRPELRSLLPHILILNILSSKYSY